MNSIPNMERKPRPKGVTNLARTATRDKVYDRMIAHYLKGQIPDAHSLSAYEFAQLYNIPDNLIQARIKDGLVSGLIQDGNMVETLEAERLKILSSSLYRIGDSDLQLNRLLAYLGRRILTNPRSFPDLIKEYNSAIGTQVRLTETSFKAITLLNQALDYAIQTPSEVVKEQHLTRDQALEQIERMALDGNLEQYLEGTPDLAPHNLGLKDKEKFNTAAVHEFNAAEDVEEVKPTKQITVSPR